MHYTNKNWGRFVFHLLWQCPAGILTRNVRILNLDPRKAGILTRKISADNHATQTYRTTIDQFFIHIESQCF